MWKRIGLLVVGAVAVAGVFVLGERSRLAPPRPPGNVTPANDTYALLVGCSEYPALEKANPDSAASIIRLLGPENDMRLMHEVLRKYLGVPEENIRVLTGWPDDPASRPSRANILGHLDRLAREVPSGARVMFCFAGHGALQTEAAGGDEADRADEVLLPADAGHGGKTGALGVANAITDDEIGARLIALRDAGATVWAMFDCCHSGTITRGPPSGEDDFGDARSRGLPAEILGIAEPSSAASSRGLGDEPASRFLKRDRGGSGGIAVLSAAQSWEMAPEMVLPRSRLAPDREAHGLCTFLVAQTLMRYGGGLTVAEVFEHARQGYASLPWKDATPGVEGDLSLCVLQRYETGSPALLLRRDGERLILDAGSLRSLTVGSELDVYRPGAFGDPAGLLGRITLTEVQPLRSTCGTAPGGPDLSTIPDKAPARVAVRAPGGPALRLGYVDVQGAPVPTDRATRLAETIFPDAEARSQFPFVAPALAAWLLRELPIGSDGVSRFVLASQGSPAGLEPIEVALEDIGSVLGRVRRAAMWRGLAQGGPGSRMPDGVVVGVRLERFDSGSTEALSPGTAVLPGDRILLEIANRTDGNLDLIVSYLDATQGDTHWWPKGDSARRLGPYDTEPVEVDAIDVSDDALGRESLLLIAAVRPEGTSLLDVSALNAPLPGVVRSVASEEAPLDSVAVQEIPWITTWGRFAYPSTYNARMTPLDPPIQNALGETAGTPPPRQRATWHRALVLPGRGEAADALLLLGEGETAGETAMAVFLDADGDANLGGMDTAETARWASAGQMPAELSILSVGGRLWAAYPRSPGDLALGLVLEGSEAPDRAVRRFDLHPQGWAARDTCGPWLSTRFVPAADADARWRMITALRQFFRAP